MFTNICIEGIDKSGKGIVAEYIKRLSNHKYTVFDRGIISEITYSNMFNRNYKFDIEPYKKFVFVYLTVQKEDWDIRCKLTNENKIDFYENLDNFNKTVCQLKNNGFHIIDFSTTEKTPYTIAIEVIKLMEKLNS